MKLIVRYFCLLSVLATNVYANPKEAWEKWRIEQEASAKTEKNSPFTLLSIRRLQKGGILYFPESPKKRVWSSQEPKEKYRLAVHWQEARRLKIVIPEEAEQSLEFGKSWTHKNLLIDSSGVENDAVRMYIYDTERNTFRRFSFFPYDEKFRVEGKFERGNARALKLLAGRDRLVDAFHIGKVKFSIGGQEAELQAYTFNDPNSKSLFIPFTDATTDKETYGAGRYLEPDLKEASDKLLTLDFNYAHNPYCAYHADYSCILVPAENRLIFAVKAGEKKYHP